MYEIIRKDQLNQAVCRFVFSEPRVAKRALPGQFVILRVSGDGERIPLTISDTDREKGEISLVVQTVGATTLRLSRMNAGERVHDILGPLGRPTELDGIRRAIVVGGGVGCAIAYPVARALKERGARVDGVIGFRNKELVIMESEFRDVCDHLSVMTDDGSYGEKGLVTDAVKRLIEGDAAPCDRVFAIGPMIMMKFVSKLTKEYNVPTVVSMNTIMIDGTGMCGGCRLTVGGETKFACVDGPDFDGHLVDFDEAMSRARAYGEFEKHAYEAECNLFKPRESAYNKRPTKNPMPVQPPEERRRNFNEVALGYTREMALDEADRCLHCKNSPCVSGCPVSIDIPGFISKVKQADFEGAYRVIALSSALPAVCGRVCPQETQCEARCVRGIKGEAVAIGRLERYVADHHQASGAADASPRKHVKMAVVGAGPAGLTCAGELNRRGYDVTVFEALHLAGGVLVYGIPQFRLPKEIVRAEIENLQKSGVQIETNAVVGRSVTVDELFDEGYRAVFIGTGAGLPSFMKIPGENLRGVYSANEFLTRVNLMKAYEVNAQTPVLKAQRVAVVGGGNVAMDAARCALRLGAQEVSIVYRRSEAEMPARREEVEHAKEEGVLFRTLTNPKEILSDGAGAVGGMRCAKMTLGEPDASGRRKPVEIPGEEIILDIDCAVIAIGTSPNPLIRSTTEGLDTDRHGCILTKDDSGLTTRENVYAGGDAVTGSATVILAMGAGKAAAKAMDEDFQKKETK